MHVRQTLCQLNYIPSPKDIFFNLFANKTSCLIPIFNPNHDGWVHPVVDLCLSVLPLLR